MKIRKTRQDQRTEYRYPVQVEDGKGGYRVVYNTIRPGDGEGEDIVTELHIQTMHSLDDSEVYYNTKNMRPQRSDSMKAEIAEWKRKYIADFVDKYGYEPHPLDVEEEIKDRFPSNWNLSLDWEMDDENTDGKPILDRDEVYSGCYARVSLNFYAFNSNGNKGVACGLGNIQKIRDGESLGGRTSAADDFKTEADDDFLA